MMTQRSWIGAVLTAMSSLGLVISNNAVAAEPPEQAVAKQIYSLAGIKGGLVVHLGCGDGKLTAALRAGDTFLVQGLDADAKNVETARKHVQSLRLYGNVSVERFSGKRLPYVDNLVNLVVVEDLGAVPRDELMRVLAPLGIACVKKDGEWIKTVKPWPKEIDEWQQHFHNADNNAVAHDSVVGPPRHYQWLAEPEWTRSHLTLPSINSLVSAKGRLFTIEDHGSAEHPALPGKFHLVARDAFNGMVLWQRPFPDWQPVNIYIKFTPAQLQRRLAVMDEKVYCTPGYSAAVTALDAITGDVLKTYRATERTTEFVYDHGVLYVVIGDPTDTRGIGVAAGGLGSSAFPDRAYGPEIPKLTNPKSTIVALRADSGEKLWEKSGGDTEGYEGTSLAVRGSNVVYSTSAELVCLNGTTGKSLWRVAAPVTLKGPPGIGVSLVLSDRTAYLADSTRLRAFRLADGKAIWDAPVTINHHKQPDVFLASGLVWAAAYDASAGRLAPELGLNRMGVNGFDPERGKLVKQIDQAMTGPMGHDRCYRNRITDRYYINTATGGSDFLDLDSHTEFPNPWARSTCGIGPLPCNGLLYTGPPACSCCNSVMLNALNALAPEPELKSSAQPIEVATRACLEKGPAYGELSTLHTPLSASDDWPTYRHDLGRTGVTQSQVPADLKPAWRTKLATRVSAPVIAAGKVFVADVDAHAVCALDAADGRQLWTYTVGARVDSPPTYYKGFVLFGSRDGWAYCLRASDGTLAWRFKGLPEDRLICAYGQLESAWPVSGSILIKDNVACFAAGRNSFLDGGIFLWGLDPQTGRVVHQRHVFGPYGDDGFPILTSSMTGGSGIDGSKADVLLADAELVYMRQQAFRPDLSPLKLEEITKPHLIPSHGFLEAIPHHRSFWTIDTTIRYDIPTGRGGVHGDLLVMDGSQFYEVRGYTPGRAPNFDPRPHGYTLYAGVYSNPEKIELETAKKDKKGKKVTQRASVIASSQRWSTNIPLTGKAMALADKTLFVVGTPVEFPEGDLAKAYEGRMGGVLWVASTETGQKLREYKLDAPPAWDGMAATQGKLYISLNDGSLLCLGAKN